MHVKLKVLKIIKHCCMSGHATFRRDMQRSTQEIKECLQYRGTPDPLHGDSLNKQVREMAQEVMTSIFDTSVQQQSAAPMQGFGSGSMGQPGPGGFQPPQPGMPGGGWNQPGAQPGFSGPPAGPDPSTFAYAPKVETGAYSTGKMQGFGNPNFNPKKEESKMGALASSMASGFKDGFNKIASKAGNSGGGGGGPGSAFGAGLESSCGKRVRRPATTSVEL